MSATRTRVPDDVIPILRRSTFAGNVLTLPEQLDRETYLRVAKVLTAARGKWNRKANGHVFPFDPRELIGAVVEDGVVVDAKKTLGFFETPDALAQRLIGLSGIGARGDRAGAERRPRPDRQASARQGRQSRRRRDRPDQRQGAPPTRRRPHGTLRAIRGISGPRGRAVRRGHYEPAVRQQSRHEAHPSRLGVRQARPSTDRHLLGGSVLPARHRGQGVPRVARRDRRRRGAAARQHLPRERDRRRHQDHLRPKPEAAAPAADASPPSAEILDIPMDQIEPDPDQPRQVFEPVALRELAASIRADGLLQPIAVRPSTTGRTPYVIAVGERRWRAHQINEARHHPGNRGRTEKHHRPPRDADHRERPAVRTSRRLNRRGHIIR